MNPNQGSFGAAIAPGAGNPIMEALQRRGFSGSPTTAQSSISQTPTPVPVPQTNPQIGSQTVPIGAETAPIVGLPPQTKESELIIRALTDRLKTFSKIEESQSIPPKLSEPQITGGI